MTWAEGFAAYLDSYEVLENPRLNGKFRYNVNGPKPSAGNTRRGLTPHRTSLDRRAAMQSICAFDGCTRTTRSNGLCGAHSLQKRRGRPLTALRPQRPHGLTVAEVWERNVIRGEGCWDWAGPITRDGYALITSGHDSIWAHRVSWELHNRAIPEGWLVDHICRNRQCSNPEHLRLATSKQNNENRGPNPGTRSGVRGVSWNTARQRWSVRVIHNHVSHFGGYFTDLGEAEDAAVALRLRFFTHNAEDRS